jgi:NAD+ kinase
VPTIAVAYHGLLAEAEELAEALAKKFSSHANWWRSSVDTIHQRSEELDATDLLITVGGDGTTLRAVHVAAPREIPVLGINMGRVGFMSEIEAHTALEETAWYLEGNARIEERTMIQAQISPDSTATNESPEIRESQTPYHALNDIVVGRGRAIRLVDLKVVVDGVYLETYRADGLVVATATGSTGYALALGGPVMDPEGRSFLLKPVAAHMSLQGGLVLRAGSTLEITLETDIEAVCSVDGFTEFPVASNQTVSVEVSPHVARMLRRGPPTAFYASVTDRLGMRQGAYRPTRE